MPNPSSDPEQATPLHVDSLTANPSVDQHCQTIAHVAALATWVDRKLPEILHIALSDGVAPTDAAAAAGITVCDLANRWQRWAQQARLAEALTTAEYERIKALLTDVSHQTR